MTLTVAIIIILQGAGVGNQQQRLQRVDFILVVAIFQAEHLKYTR